MPEPDTNKKNNSSEAESKDKDATKVDIGSSGIHVTDEDGSKVDIDSSGVHVVEKDGSKVDINISGVEIKDKDGNVYIKNNKDSKWKGYKKEISNIWKAIFKLISGIGLLIFIGGIFFVTVLYSWIVYNGDVSHQRLLAKGFEKAPTSFKFLNISYQYKHKFS